MHALWLEIYLPPFFVAFVAWIISASIVPPLISGPSSSGGFHTKNLSTSNSSIRSISHGLVSSLHSALSADFAAGVSTVVCSNKSGSVFVWGAWVTGRDSVGDATRGGDDLAWLIRVLCLGGNAGGVELIGETIDEFGDGIGEGSLKTT